MSLLTRIFKLIVRFAPAHRRNDWGQDACTTFVATCEKALQTRGWLGLARVAGAELLDLVRAVLIARFERRRDSSGWSPGSLDPGTHVADPRSPRVWGIRLWRDVGLAVRALRSGGMTTITAAATLAIGIGTAATIFSVLDSILWRQVPFREPSSIVELANFNVAQKMTYGGFRRELVLEWRRQTDLVSSLEAFQRASFVFAGDRGTQMIPGAVITPGLFNLLGVGPQEGRTFGAADGRGGTAQLAIVSHTFWREQLGGTALAIGRELILDGRRYQVIGVMPATFRFPSGLEQIWTPSDIDQPPADAPQPRNMTPVARLAAGMGRDDADRQVRARGEALSIATGGRAGTTATIQSTGDSVDEASERSLGVLSGAVCFLFLIVCANVANLTLSRASARARDLATCAALGATPGDLGRLALLEQGLLALVGVAGGAALAYGGVAVAVATLPESMTSGTLNVIDLDGRTLLFLMAGGAIAALLSGLAPALVATRTQVVRVLNSTGRSSSSVANRFRTALAVVEVAVSVLLLIGSALMTRTFLNRALEDPGFEARNLVSLRVGFPGRYKPISVRDKAAIDLSARLQSLAGARSTVGGLPSEVDLMSFGQFEFDNRPGVQTEPLAVPVHEVPPDYFDVVGIRILRGRSFSAADTGKPVVVNERFVRKFFGNEDPLGRRFKVGEGLWRTVVGVVEETSAATAGGERRVETFYPIGSASDAYRPTLNSSSVIDFRTFLIRVPQGSATIPALMGVVQAFDPSLVVWKAAMVEDLLAEAIARPRAIFLLMSVFAGVGLVLSTAGLYAVLAHLVAQRRREFGVRLALGASSLQVRRSVLGRGLAIAAAGVTIGLIGTVSLAGTMRALLYEVSPVDPISVTLATMLVGLTALFACWWPARNAGRVDPVELLRD